MSRWLVLLRTTAFAFGFAATFMLGLVGVASRSVAGDSITACQLEPGPEQTVTHVIDGETLRLDDGRDLKLAGVLAPRATDFDTGADGPSSFEDSAKQSLAKLANGKRVKLGFGDGVRTDRYGRHTAQVFVVDGVEAVWLQGRLLETGQVRAAITHSDEACVLDLLIAEARARQARQGIWTSTAYAITRGVSSLDVKTHRGRFHIIQDHVLSVRATRAATYLNFGPDWKTDFTVRVDAPVLKRFPELAARLLRFEGQRVEVRGWIERRNGPMMTLVHPDQIQRVEAVKTEPILPSSSDDGIQ